MVDDSDFEFLSQWKWSYASGYAQRNQSSVSGARNGIKMHQAIIPTRKGLEVDHIDGNSLNNQRSNLRVCTHAQNCRNQKLRCDSRTGVKGVDFHKKTGKYRARVTVKYQVINLGLFETLEEAKNAYDTAAKKLHGTFARLNKH